MLVHEQLVIDRNVALINGFHLRLFNVLFSTNGYLIKNPIFCFTVHSTCFLSVSVPFSKRTVHTPSSGNCLFQNLTFLKPFRLKKDCMVIFFLRVFQEKSEILKKAVSGRWYMDSKLFSTEIPPGILWFGLCTR